MVPMPVLRTRDVVERTVCVCTSGQKSLRALFLSSGSGGILCSRLKCTGTVFRIRKQSTVPGGTRGLRW
jgi:hypothetical protein